LADLFPHSEEEKENWAFVEYEKKPLPDEPWTEEDLQRWFAEQLPPAKE
jgi:hypothetical protein